MRGRDTLLQSRIVVRIHLFQIKHSANIVSGYIDPNSGPVTLAKLQNPLKSSWDKVTDDLKKIHKGHRDYGKALDRVGF